MTGYSFSDQIGLLAALFGISIPLGVIATTIIEARHLYHGSSDSLNGLVAITIVAVIGLVLVALGLWWRFNFYGLWDPGANKRAIGALSIGLTLDGLAAAGMILAFMHA